MQAYRKEVKQLLKTNKNNFINASNDNVYTLDKDTPEVKKYADFNDYWANGLNVRIKETNNELEELNRVKAYNKKHEQIIDTLKLLKLSLLQSYHAYNQFKYNEDVYIYGEDDSISYSCDLDEYKSYLSFEEYNNVGLINLHISQSITRLEKLHIDYIKLSKKVNMI